MKVDTLISWLIAEYETNRLSAIRVRHSIYLFIEAAFCICIYAAHHDPKLKPSPAVENRSDGSIVSFVAALLARAGILQHTKIELWCGCTARHRRERHIVNPLQPCHVLAYLYFVHRYVLVMVETIQSSETTLVSHSHPMVRLDNNS